MVAQPFRTSIVAYGGFALIGQTGEHALLGSGLAGAAAVFEPAEKIALNNFRASFLLISS